MNGAAAKPKHQGAEKKNLEAIHSDYEKTVKPIFEKKCMDCHSQNTKYPWYYRLPFAKSLIDSDIKEAKSHLDMTAGFPFEGHGTPAGDLEEIARVIRERTMPPFRYLIMNPSAGITAAEEKEVLDWVGRSLKRLESK